MIKALLKFQFLKLVRNLAASDTPLEKVRVLSILKAKFATCTHYAEARLFAARATNSRVHRDRNFAPKTEFRYLNGFRRTLLRRFRIKTLHKSRYCYGSLLISRNYVGYAQFSRLRMRNVWSTVLPFEVTLVMN